MENVFSGVIIAVNRALTVGCEASRIEEVKFNGSSITVYQAWVALGIDTNRNQQIRVIDIKVLNNDVEERRRGNIAVLTVSHKNM